MVVFRVTDAVAGTEAKDAVAYTTGRTISAVALGYGAIPVEEYKPGVVVVDTTAIVFATRT